MNRKVTFSSLIVFLLRNKAVILISLFGSFPSLIFYIESSKSHNLKFLIFPIVVVILFLISAIYRFKYINLLYEGVITDGVVNLIEKLNLYTGKGKNKKSFYKVSVNCRSFDGKIFENKSTEGKKKFDNENFPKIGDNRKVIYDPKNPNVSKRLDIYFRDFEFSDKEVTVPNSSYISSLIMPLTFIVIHLTGIALLFLNK